MSQSCVAINNYNNYSLIIMIIIKLYSHVLRNIYSTIKNIMCPFLVMVRAQCVITRDMHMTYICVSLEGCSADIN